MERKDRLKTKHIQAAIYPTPAPEVGKTLIDTDLFEAITAVCQKLLDTGVGLRDVSSSEVEAHFKNLFSLTNPAYHLEIISDEELHFYEKLWEHLQQIFPQFAWLSLRKADSRNKFVYHIAFLPLATNGKAFPFEINFQESVLQQFAKPNEKSMSLVEAKVITIIEELGEGTSVEETSETDDDEPDYLEDDQADDFEEVEEYEADLDDQEDETDNSVETNLIVPDLISKVQDLKGELKAEKLQRQRVKNTNKKLELMIEQLEKSLVANSISYFGEVDQDDDEWDKILKIDLREYTYLIQKAKYLEQMWQMNGKLVNRSEKMTVSNDRLIYEREQVDQIKDSFSANEVNFAMYESQMIEQRVQIRSRTFLGIGKPHVKIMKMDYDNLVSKAAYFDLLQGETIILEKIAEEDVFLDN